MARLCTVCQHPDRLAIDQALVAGEPVRKMASRYVTLGRMALQRHKDAHLPAAVVQAQGVREIARADKVLAELRQQKEHLDRLSQAADRALRDPDHPDRYVLDDGDAAALLLKASAAKGAYLRLLVDVLDDLHNVREVERFETAVLEAIGEAAPDVRDCIIESLTAGQRALRLESAVT